MNKLVITFLLILFAGTTKAQVPYVSMDFENSVWSEFYYSLWIINSYYDVEVNGDTLINDVEYHKLHRTGITYIYDDVWQTEISDSLEINGYSGAIRESEQKQILFVSPTSNEERVLFDYNIILGDTLDLSGNGNPDNIGVVYEIDSTEICGTWRNRYRIDFLTSGFRTDLIEGIGSSAGIIPRYEVFESGSTLLCYSQDNCECGDLIVNVKNLVTNDSEFDIFPNPINDHLTIEPLNGSGENNVMIINLIGQKIYSYNGKGIINIDCSKWIPGVYFLIIEKNGQKETHRMIKL